jgi:hypothetical protein
MIGANASDILAFLILISSGAKGNITAEPNCAPYMQRYAEYWFFNYIAEDQKWACFHWV